MLRLVELPGQGHCFLYEGTYWTQQLVVRIKIATNPLRHLFLFDNFGGEYWLKVWFKEMNQP